MPKPPAGFKAETYPLRHKFAYSFGLSCFDAPNNSTICTLVKNYTDATNAPKTITVNPHGDAFEVETGAICGGMSIIDRLRLTLKFSLTENSTHIEDVQGLQMSWTPIFFSFPEKLDAADITTSTTVASILSLTKDATKEDITPAFATKLLTTGTTSEKAHPVSSANFTEVFGTLNLTTNTGMEGVPHDQEVLISALKYYTNKGALKACIGRTRSFTLNSQGGKSIRTFHIRKFVPRAVRRIVPYSFFGILIHVPLTTDVEQHFHAPTPATGLIHVGVKVLCAYDEWNPEHIQEVTTA